MKLKEIRLSKHITQYKLSEISGISHTAVAAIERGQKSPTLNTLTKLASALGVSISELIGEDYQEKEVRR